MIQKPIPKFTSEQEEAQWWDEHRDETAEWMEQAIADGQTTTLSEVFERKRQVKRPRSLAAKKGLRYQT